MFMIGGIETAAKRAEEGMSSTKTMASLAGRANYVAQERMEGTPDPGAYAMHIAFLVAKLCM
jgi:dihydroxyacetone kinase